MKTNQLTRSAIVLTLVFVVTRYIQIPIPLGYINIGNAILLFGCLFVDSPYGMMAGSIGSALADLVSYPVYTIPTLVIKFVMPMLFYKIKEKRLAFMISTLVPLFGYTITGMILYRSIFMGLSQFPGLVVEYIANGIIFYILTRKMKEN